MIWCRLLKFLGYRSEECSKVGGVMSDGCHGYVEALVHKVVDGGGEGGESAEFSHPTCLQVF